MARRLFNYRVLILAAVLAIGGIACVDDCLQIQDTLCNCYGKTSAELSACENNASTQEQIAPPDAGQVAICASLLPGCMKAIANGDNCPALQTIQGRQACGIAEMQIQDGVP